MIFNKRYRISVGADLSCNRRFIGPSLDLPISGLFNKSHYRSLGVARGLARVSTPNSPAASDASVTTDAKSAGVSQIISVLSLSLSVNLQKPG
jgi:hypothetical protein